MISPTLGEVGSATVSPPDVVLTKYPLPLAAVNPAVFTVVHQFTVPVRPRPTAVPLFVIVAPQSTVRLPPDKTFISPLELTFILAPDGIKRLSRLSPNVVSVPVTGMILFTSILSAFTHTVSPLSPTVTVVPDCGLTLFTLISLI